MNSIKVKREIAYFKHLRKSVVSLQLLIAVFALLIFSLDSIEAQNITFRASKRSIDIGDTTMLIWHIKFAGRKDSISISGIDGPLHAKGEVEIIPVEDTKYTLTYKHKNKVITKFLKIKVRKPEIVYFRGPDSIAFKSNCVLSWKTRYISKLELENEDTYLPFNDSIILTPSSPTEYKLKACNKRNYCVTATHKVKMSGDYVKGPSILRFGENGLLEWRFENAKRVDILGVDSMLPAEGAKKISRSSTTEYKFMAHIKTGNDKDSVIFKSVKVPVVRSNFITGVKNYFTLPSGRKLMFDIYAVNWRNFPEEIRMKVMITDTSGNYISGLAPPYISEAECRKFFKTIIETVEDKRYPINYFTVKEIRTMTSTPYDISLVLDYSGSMNSSFNKLDKATQNFIKKSNKDDRLGIIRFDDSIGIESPLVKNTSELMNKLAFNNGEGYGGSTALYAAADAGMRLLGDSLRDRQMLLMTDGFENSSMFYWGTYFTFATEVIMAARKNKVTINTIDFMGQANSPLLEAMADMSGGKYYQLKNEKDIEKVFDELQHLYHNYYEVVYKPATSKGNRIIDLVYDDGTKQYATARTVAYIDDSLNIEAVENEGIVNNTNNTNSTSGTHQTVTTRQTVALFEFNKSDLKEDSKKKLDVVVNYLKMSPDFNIIIKGHSDLKGTDAYCQKISNARAKEVNKYLRKNGIPASRITGEGKGKSEPVWAVEDIEWKARENRRVDIEFVK